jgi:hypothetical protein
MADTKITGLTNFDSSNTPYWPPAPASDVIPIVDVSDTTMAGSGTTKKISINNLLSSSPTATGALTVTGLVTAGSATITGAATVGTTLGVTGVSTLTGAVGVGATPIGKFDVYAVASDTNIFIRSDTDKSGQIVFRDNLNAGNSGKVRYDHLNERLSFAADGAENLYLLSTGDLSVTTGNVVMATSGKGIDFSATANGSGTMTSELLNDYEEGTFTPSIATGATGVTYSTQAGSYTKVGRLVTVLVQITTSAATRNGSIFNISGLPFASSNFGSGVIAFSNSGFVSTAGGNKPNMYVTGSTVDFYTSAGSAFAGTAIATDAFDVRFTATYFV